MRIYFFSNDQIPTEELPLY